MKNKQKLKDSISPLEYIVKEPYILKDIDRLRGKLAEEKTITNLLELGVDPIIIKQTFCNYFWSKFYKEKYASKIRYHKSGEKAGVPTSLFAIDYKYLETRLLYWTKECEKIENMYIASIERAVEIEKNEKIVEEIIEKTRQNDKRVTATFEAIERYSKKSGLEKIKDNITRKNPQKINFDNLSIEQIENLYVSKKVR